MSKITFLLTYLHTYLPKFHEGWMNSYWKFQFQRVKIPVKKKRAHPPFCVGRVTLITFCFYWWRVGNAHVMRHYNHNSQSTKSWKTIPFSGMHYSRLTYNNCLMSACRIWYGRYQVIAISYPKRAFGTTVLLKTNKKLQYFCFLAFPADLHLQYLWFMAHKLRCHGLYWYAMTSSLLIIFFCAFLLMTSSKNKRYASFFYQKCFWLCLLKSVHTWSDGNKNTCPLMYQSRWA